MVTSAGLFSSMAGVLSTATIRCAGGRSGSDMAQRPAPTSRTVAPAASGSRARRCDGEMSGCLVSNSATGRAQGSSRAWARIRSGIAHDASASFQRVAASGARLTSGLTSGTGYWLPRDVGESVEQVVNPQGGTDDDDRDGTELAERDAGQVGDEAYRKAGPAPHRLLSVHARRQQIGVAQRVRPDAAEKDRDDGGVEPVEAGGRVGVAGHLDVAPEHRRGEGEKDDRHKQQQVQKYKGPVHPGNPLEERVV